MIIRATVKNIYSFNEETEINFIAGKGTSHSEQVCRAVKRDDISTLKAGIIYGANASGKSNIVKAIDILQKIALGTVPKNDFAPFKLSENHQPTSKIELEFKVGSKFYAYGVEFSIRGIAEEWMFEINNRTDKEIFTRKVSSEGNDFTFGNIEGSSENRQFIKYISQGTPINNSFLSEYIIRNGKGINSITEVHQWIKNNLRIIFPESRFDGLSFRVGKDEDFAQATRSLLQYFNTGIVDIRLVPIERNEIDIDSNIINDVIEACEPGKAFAVASDSSLYLIETNSNGITTTYKQYAIHLSEDGKEIPFEMNEESDGSLRLLDFIPMLIDLRLNNTVYIIDEIDRSMHPLLSQKILEYYFEYLAENRDTQLIFTTHESHLLDLDLVRADEVWFVEKDKKGASHMTSLAEYKPRTDIRKGYLQGRYGAIPFFAPIKSLKW